jgi:hypothetical protein
MAVGCALRGRGLLCGLSSETTEQKENLGIFGIKNDLLMGIQNIRSQAPAWNVKIPCLSSEPGQNQPQTVRSRQIVWRWQHLSPLRKTECGISELHAHTFAM